MAYRDPATGAWVATPPRTTLGNTASDPSGASASATSEAASGGIISTPAGPTTTQSAALYTFRWLLAWTIVITLASLANRTRIGHTILYYLIALALLLLIVTQYRWLASALAPITGVVSVQPVTTAATP